ncbi:MAG: D-glycerate dehydrogenase [Sphingomonadales bacterium]|nr:D-glycerate dehydrogenase [Sphingomonadales bacterium]
MAITVLTVRPLPLPPIKARGEDINFVPLSEGAANAEVLLATGTDPVDATTIAALPETVGLIANFGVGTDNIDLEAARVRGIKVSNTPVVTEDTADLAFALILAASRRIAAADRYVRAGRWAEHVAFPLGQRVHGTRLGIVGFGAIGQAVARRASGFAMKVSYWARAAKDEGTALGAAHVADLGDLVANSDIVSLHLPLNPQTRHLFDAALLGRFNPGAVLVNTGRGALIDEAALVAALEAGTIGAAGLDVFEHEPQVDPRLLTMDQVVLAPHIGSATGPCRADMGARALGNVIAFLETGKPHDRVV